MLEYDPFSDAILDDPYPVYARLRDESPVHYLERHDAWAISRFFTPNAMRRLEPELRQLVRELLAVVVPRGSFDLMCDLASHISVQVACRLIGLPLEDSAALAAIVQRVFAREPGFEGMPPDALAAVGELRAYLEDAVRERVKRGAEHFDDMMSAYIAIELEGRRYDDTSLGSHLTLLVTGGTETLPYCIVAELDDLAGDPQVRHNELLVELDHPKAGRIRQPRAPALFGATAPDPARPAPELGQHTEEVLLEAGLAASQIAALRTTGAFGDTGG